LLKIAKLFLHPKYLTKMRLRIKVINFKINKRLPSARVYKKMTTK
jgi:hypothetical protein